MKKMVFYIYVCVGLCACNQTDMQVTSVHDKTAFEKFKKLDLDATYQNLLNPDFSTKEQYTEVVNSWRGFHEKVNTILQTNKFSWEVAKPTITVVNKIYFDKNGNIDHFLVNIKNPDISDEVKESYRKLLAENIDKLSINLKRKEQFAQCGKVKYQNYE
ncbi:hypothetical protein [Tenacibaculum amylolyticum]|uniref:hypothetical protein n=1 Tax=Tenacibaculum amylolyticum TaxID=104269 RepID=UPI0038949827